MTLDVRNTHFVFPDLIVRHVEFRAVCAVEQRSKAVSREMALVTRKRSRDIGGKYFVPLRRVHATSGWRPRSRAPQLLKAPASAADAFTRPSCRWRLFDDQAATRPMGASRVGSCGGPACYVSRIRAGVHWPYRHDGAGWDRRGASRGERRDFRSAEPEYGDGRAGRGAFSEPASGHVSGEGVAVRLRRIPQ